MQTLIQSWNIKSYHRHTDICLKLSQVIIFLIKLKTVDIMFTQKLKHTLWCEWSRYTFWTRVDTRL